jgi:hypothetical protein
MSKDKCLLSSPKLTVGELIKVLQNENPDDILIICNPDLGSTESALNVISVDTYWHGAVTFNANPTLA